MVKLNLNNGTNNLDMEGKAVIAIVIDPVGHDADCEALMAEIFASCRGLAAEPESALSSTNWAERHSIE